MQGHGLQRSQLIRRRYEKHGMSMIELNKLTTATRLKLLRLEQQGTLSLDQRCTELPRSGAVK